VTGGFLAVIRDRTEERRQMRELEERTSELSRKNAELERASRAKDEFLATMSHELRTPLNPVLGLAEALREEIYGPLNERQKQALDTIEVSGRHLLQLLGDILMLVRLDAGSEEIAQELVDAVPICEEALAITKAKARSGGLSVVLELDVAGAWFMGDARRLRQIVLNLLSNAVKFTPPGGRVGLSVTTSREKGELSVVVWDTGIGIRAADRARLFQPFVQVDSSLSRRHEGAGLGLALVARFTRRMGGRVELESTPDAGTRVTVTFPLESR
jgi:signal transduction histidine kinase